MRICYIAPAESIHTQRVANYFAKSGHEVHLISSRFIDGYDGRVKMYPLVRLLPQIWRVSIYPSGIICLFQVRQLINRIKPDIVDTHYISFNAYFGAISGFHPLILTAWGSDILVAPKQNPVRRFLTRQTLRRADHIVCYAPFVKDEMEKLGADPGKIGIILIGVDTERFKPVPQKEGLRRRLGMADSSPMVISTRSLAPVYDVETLIKAAPLVLKDIPQVRFVIAGGGEQQRYLESLVDRLGVSDSVRFVGWLPPDELATYLAASDIYVSTSLSDGTSSSLLEAMAWELAPVVTSIPGNQPWVKDGENGFLFPAGDHNMLAERIIYLIRNREPRAKFGKVSREIIREKAEFTTEMEKLEKLYLENVRKQ